MATMATNHAAPYSPVTVTGPTPVTGSAGFMSIPSRFTGNRIFDVLATTNSLTLVERKLVMPFYKDYDAIEKPSDWLRRFDTRNWVEFVATAEGVRLGAALVAWRTPSLEMLEERDDLAVLWDIRVHPKARTRGIGRALFQAVEHWAQVNGCTELKVETQNVNHGACRFYEAMGCALSQARTGAYQTLPDEVELLFRKPLGRATPGISEQPEDQARSQRPREP